MDEKRLIDANALEEVIVKAYFSDSNGGSMVLSRQGEQIFNAALDVVRSKIREAETIVTEEADLVEDRTNYRCSACNTVFHDQIAFIYPGFEEWPKFCPECGRRFKEVPSDE